MKGSPTFLAAALCGLAVSVVSAQNAGSALGRIPAGDPISNLHFSYDALHDSVAATVSTLVGAPQRTEAATSHGPGRRVVAAVREVHLPGE